MHRNTFLLVSSLAVVAALLVGINIGRGLSSPLPLQTATITPTPRPSLSPSPQPRIPYTNAACGISLTLPEHFGANPIQNATYSAIFINPSVDAQDAIAFACQKQIPRPPVAEDKMEKVTIGTISATLYHDADAKSGTPIDKLIFRHPGNGLDIFLAGRGQTLQLLFSTITLLP